MNDFIRSYFGSLKASLDGVCVTDPEGRLLPLEDAVRRAVELIGARAAASKKLYLVGNGGSAGIASHQAVDFWKNAHVPALAFNDASLLTCIANDFGYPHVFEKPVEMFVEEGDILIAISSSGESENILRAVGAAKAKGAAVLTLSGFDESNRLRGCGVLNFYVPSSEYGSVEITHLSLLHCMVDTLIHSRGSARVSS